MNVNSIIFAKAIISALFIYLAYSILNALSLGVWDWNAALNLISQLVTFGAYAVSLLSNGIMWFFQSLAILLTGYIPLYAQSILYVFNEYFYDRFLGFMLTMDVNLISLGIDAYHFGVQLLTVISILSMIWYLKNLNIKFSILSITSINIVVLLAAFFHDISLGLNAMVGNPFEIFTIPAFQIALLSYIYVELCMYFTYLQELSYEEKEYEVETPLEYVQKLDVEIEAEMETSPRTVGKTDTFHYLREVLEKRSSKESRSTLEKIRTAQKLASYLERLKMEDPEAEETLSGKKLMRAPKKVFKSSVLELGLRIIGVAILVAICINPSFVLSLFNVPTPIIQSVELTTPEAVIILLLPIALTFPLAALIIDYFKRKQSRLNTPESVGTENKYENHRV
ncbi:MAG: hypothetical protein ACTSSJ_06670 [Candidatus Odinarchaeia archaeon]